MVFDVNVYVRACVQLDVATWPSDWRGPYASMEEAALSAVAAVSGRDPDVTTSTSVRVYSSEDLDDLVLRKLTQPDNARFPPEQRGLGYSEARALEFYQEVVDVLDAPGGSVVVDPPPPAVQLADIDYEDQCIWGLFREAMNRDPTAVPFFVTDDRSLALNAALAARAANPERPAWEVRSPTTFCLDLAALVT